MLPLGDVQEHTVNEKEESLNVEELAPGQAQIEEKFSQSFIINASFVLLFKPSSFCYNFLFASCPKPILFFLIHVLLIFLLKFFIWEFLFRLLFLDFLKVTVLKIFALILLLLLSFHINFPILFSWLTCRFFIKVKYETLLDLNVQIDILILCESTVVVLLHKIEPLGQDSLELQMVWIIKCLNLPEYDSKGLFSSWVLDPHQ